jgi:hypothetical protein
VRATAGRVGPEGEASFSSYAGKRHCLDALVHTQLRVADISETGIIKRRGSDDSELQQGQGASTRPAHFD